MVDELPWPDFFCFRGRKQLAESGIIVSMEMLELVKQFILTRSRLPEADYKINLTQVGYVVEFR